MRVRLPSFLQYGIENPREALYGTGAGSAPETADEGMSKAEAEADEDEEVEVESPLAKKIVSSDDESGNARKRVRQ